MVMPYMESTMSLMLKLHIQNSKISKAITLTDTKKFKKWIKGHIKKLSKMQNKQLKEMQNDQGQPLQLNQQNTWVAYCDLQESWGDNLEEEEYEQD